MKSPITRAMVLAAGLGTRLRPLTDKTPKPLVPVLGKPLIDHALDRLARVGVTQAVVNIHHKPELMEAHLRGRTNPRVTISNEADQLLDTGGGVAKALALLGEGPFYCMNGDAILLDAREDALLALRAAWDDARMDALLLLHPTVSAVGYEGRGDYFMAADGLLERRDERVTAPFVFTGARILHPRLFKDAPKGAFSMVRLFDQAQTQGRLYGLRHDGLWADCGTLDSIQAIEKAMA